MEAELRQNFELRKKTQISASSHIGPCPFLHVVMYTWANVMRQAELNHHASPEAHLPIPCYLATRPAVLICLRPHAAKCKYLRLAPTSPPLGRRPTT